LPEAIWFELRRQCNLLQLGIVAFLGLGGRCIADWLEGAAAAQAMRYALRHWSGLIVFLEDGRIEIDTNVVERAIRPIPMTRKAALFAGPYNGARPWTIAMTLIQTANLNGVEPMGWLKDVLERIVSGRTDAH
jgi:hypothetical protein